MLVSVTDAKAQLIDLVRRAEEGEDIILTRRGQPVARIAPVKAPARREMRRQAILSARAAAGRAIAGANAARSQDFLYGDDGLPG